MYNLPKEKKRFYLCINWESSFIEFFVDGGIIANISDYVPDPTQYKLGFFINNLISDNGTILWNEDEVLSESYVKIHWTGFPINSNLRNNCSGMKFCYEI